MPRKLLLLLIIILVDKGFSQIQTNNIDSSFKNCTELIPNFIQHINDHGNNGECDKVGEFPRPGDCTGFFKCVKGNGKITPFLEYCAIGYTFNGRICIRNHNETDCRQYICKKDKPNTSQQLVLTENTQNKGFRLSCGLSTISLLTMITSWAIVNRFY